MNPRCVSDVAREREGQDGDRPTHQDSGRSEQQSRQHDIERESERVVVEWAEQRQLLGEPKQYGKQQGINADSGLDARVEGQQPRTPAPPTSALEHSPRCPAEKRVPSRKAAEKDREHGRGRLAMGSEQRGQVFLPGHLVDEARKPGQHREQQRDQANHRYGSTSSIGQAQGTVNIARGRCHRLRSSSKGWSA